MIRPNAGRGAGSGRDRRNRATCARLAAYLILLLAASAACGPAPTRLAGVILLVLDTVRADRCGFAEPAGEQRSTTPALDRLASDSVVFEDCWSPASWTAPAVASVFTGAPPDVHLVRNGGRLHLGPSHRTIAEILARDGFDTGLWSANPVVSSAFGLERGFAHGAVAAAVGGHPAPAGASLMPMAEFIRSRAAARRPFFAAAVLMEAHMPHVASAASLDRFRTREVSEADVARVAEMRSPAVVADYHEASSRTPGLLASLSAVYDAEVHDLDLAVGSFLDGLRADGILDRSFVVVCGDHGEGLGDHGWIEHGIRLDRSLLRVPLIVRPPGGIPGGRRVRDVVRLEDVAPTIARAAGAAFSAPEHGGEDLLSGTSGRTAFAFEGPAAAMLAMLRQSHPGQAFPMISAARVSVRWDRWHVVIDERSAPTAFDVVADPRETRDVASANPAVVEEARRRAAGRRWR